MSIVLIWLYIIVNVYIILKHYKNHLGVFEFPFLISMTSLVFVVPSLFLILRFYGNNADGVMTLPLIVFILCNYSFYYGFNRAVRKNENGFVKESFDMSKGKWVVFVFAAIGLYATLKNRGEYQGGFVEGAYVIISFFTGYLAIAMNMVFVCIYKKYKIPFYFYVVLAVALLLQIEQFVTIARRAQAMQTFITCAFFYFLCNDTIKYRKYKFVIPLIFFVGFLLNSQVSSYRSNAYSKEFSIWENIQTLTLSNSQDMVVSDLYGNEVHNAMLGINDVSRNMSFDFGFFNWNEIVHDFVPKAIVGAEIKSGLMVDVGGSKQAETLQSSGSTMTGYYDAYSSFGILGFVKFLLIGYLMGYFWRKRSYSVNYLLLYVCMFSSVMEIVSHSSNYPVSRLIFYFAFAYPFIRLTFKKVSVQ